MGDVWVGSMRLLVSPKITSERGLKSAWSISSTFYARVFRRKVLFYQNKTREKHFCIKNVCVKR